MERLFGENETPSGTDGTVIPDFFALIYAKKWNGFLASDRHSWNGWNSSGGGRGSSF